MCNELLENSQPIPEKGYGWKIFRGKNQSLISVRYTRRLNRLNTYINKKEGFTTWLDKYDGDGFCFFLTKKEATEALKCILFWGGPYYANITIEIKKIQYREGLGKHSESHTVMDKDGDDVTIALCKQFKIAEEA